jgi:hypothetical protein
MGSGCPPWTDSRVFYGLIHSRLIRGTVAENGPWCGRTYMKSTSESLSHPETSCGKAAKGNCVVARRGGEQPEADLRSQTKVNPIRFTTTASLLGNGEACRMSGNRFPLNPSSTREKRAVADGWGENAGKVSCGCVESCPGRNPRERNRAEVRAAIVATKRGIGSNEAGGAAEAVDVVRIIIVGQTATLPGWGSFACWMPKPRKPPVSVKEQTTNWRAV